MMTNRELQNSEIRAMYEEKISSAYSDNYEFNRWFTTARLRLDYFMTYLSIQYHLRKVDFQTCLELGPGPGTWTRLLYRRNKDAAFDLVDISDAMKGQFGLEMRENENINYVVGDFLHYQPERQYDLFFTSRAIEYFEDLDLLFKKISQSLKPGGTGVIVTKNPNHTSVGKFLNFYKKRRQHTGQISTKQMEEMLHMNGLSEVNFYPCIIRVPVLDRFVPFLANQIFKVSYKAATKQLSALAESYVVTFKKD